jgi:hypothetical protein
MREEVAVECDSSCKQKCYFLIYWLQSSYVICWGNNTKVIYDSFDIVHYEDGRSNQGERGKHLTAQSFVQIFSEWQLCYIRSYLFFHYPTSHTLWWVSYHYII